MRTDWSKLDVGLVYSEAAVHDAAIYTSNKLKAAPLLVTQEHLADGKAQAIVANAGCANCATGQQGWDNAVTMAQIAGQKVGMDPHDVIVASTGVIGTQLPMDRIGPGIEKIALSADGGAGLRGGDHDDGYREEAPRRARRQLDDRRLAARASA